MLYELIWISIVLGSVLHVFVRKRIDPVITAVTLAGLLLCYWGHYHIGVNSFSHDPKSHLDAVDYIAKSGDWLAVRSTNLVIKNPLFYDVAALFYRAGQVLGMDVWFAVRQFILILYGIYIYFAFQLMTFALQDKAVRRLMYTALLFWPVALTYPVRISPDIAIGTASMAVFYYLYRWIDNPQEKQYFIYALVISGISILVKINGIANLGIVGFVMLWMLISGKTKYTVFVSKSVITAIIFSLVCIAFVYFRPAGFAERAHFLQSDANTSGILFELPVSLLFNIDEYFYYITQSPDFYPAHKSFWSTFLSSLFVGNFAGEPSRIIWQPPVLLWTIAVVGLFMYIYNFSYWCYRVWSQRNSSLYEELLFPVVIIPCMMLLMFQLLTPGQVYGNARYVVHFVALFCILYGRAMEWQWSTGRRKYYYFGLTMMHVFIITSILLFLITCGIA